MNSADWLLHCSEILSQRRDRALLRGRMTLKQIDAVHVEVDGKRYVNFASNDYLGLTHHPQVLAAASNASAAGSGAAGLITGQTEAHARCEQAIARWKATEAAVLLPSGYQANLAAVQSLAAIGQTYPQGARFLVDKLAHASLIDAVRATDVPMRVFPHNGIPKLRRLLQEADPNQLQIVLTESIFSMDGDAADLAAIAEIKARYPFVLLLDEAHGSGVYGPDGAGYAAESELSHAVDVSIVTLSKAIGCSGGAVCSSKLFCDALLNFGRAYMYSTSVSPFICESVQAAIKVMQHEPWRRQRVRELSASVRTRLRGSGMKIPDGDSPIIPIVLGEETAALKAAEKLKDDGLLVVAVRPPTVPPLSSRLRITLSCAHSDEEIERLIQAVGKID
jgi:8-amino-7-oxononanoate synthase